MSHPPLPGFMALRLGADYERAHKRKRNYAHKLVYRAVKSGKLCKGILCEECGILDNSLSGHHEDYDRPLDVVWLCGHCHGVRHGEIDREAWALLKGKT